MLGGVPGTTDGTILTRDAGLPTVVYGPGGKWIAHQVDEFVAVQDILTCTRAYIAAARHFLGAVATPSGNEQPIDGTPAATRSVGSSAVLDERRIRRSPTRSAELADRRPGHPGRAPHRGR